MLNKNIFNVSNPCKMLDALWGEIEQYKNDFSRVLIFLPSRRAIRSVEKMIVDNVGHAVILPKLVPLGNGVDEEESEEKDRAMCQQLWEGSISKPSFKTFTIESPDHNASSELTVRKFMRQHGVEHLWDLATKL